MPRSKTVEGRPPVSKRNVSAFVASQEKYIIAIEAVILAIFVIEILVRLIRLLLPAAQMVEEEARLRLIVSCLAMPSP